ncbi:DUF2917 domain-containing protein [Inhella sp.]|uniref:DUF2917 domain-containing protein n=1 Tax=Inhella sp. TaxID=1921806 RepID=UPI0035B0BAFA
MTTDPSWRLTRGQTLHRVAPQARCLRVQRGRLWVTRDGRLGELPEDLVLGAGALLELERGEGVVLEAFEDSAFEWLEPAP